jgi:hypothetical protein
MSYGWDETMKTQDPYSSPESAEKSGKMATDAPSSATALFSRNSFAPAMPTGADEVSMLLREPEAGENEANLSAETAGSTSIAQVKGELPQANHDITPAPSPERHVDLTGIFRKVQLEHPSSEIAGKQIAPVGTGENAEEGFTQMFQSLAAASAPPSHGSASVPNQNSKTKAAFSEQKLSLGQQNAEPPPVRSGESGFSQLQGAQPLAQGEFTQLFQRLDHENSGPTRAEERLSTAPAGPQFAGGFTQLLRTLSAETEAESSIPSSAPAPVFPQPTNGPGEFTRIISGSMLREAQGRTEIQAHAEATPANSERVVSPAPISSGAPAIPIALPVLSPEQLVRSAPPQAPPMPMAGPMSTPPLVPPIQAPQVQAPAVSKLQQYMPMLLIANFFLMLLVLILVAVVLLRH